MTCSGEAQRGISAAVVPHEPKGRSVTVWTAARRHWVLVLVGLLLGVLLASLAVLKVEPSVQGPRLSVRSPGDYSTNMTAVINTADFGLGSSDTDVARLAMIAPTYAEMLTSQPVLRAAQSKLPPGTAIQKADSTFPGSIDAQVSAEAVSQSPIVKVKVEARSKQLAVDTAVAVVSAFRRYLDSQQSSATPVEKRLVVMEMGAPAEPQLVSNRQKEFAVVLLLLPLAMSLGLAWRIEHSAAQGALVASVEPPAGPQVLAPDASAERMRAF